MLVRSVLLATGKLSKANRMREQASEFVAACKQHLAVESAVNHLEHRGLNRLRSYGKDGYEHMNALSALVVNPHRIGLLLQHQQRARIRRQKKSRLRVA